MNSTDLRNELASLKTSYAHNLNTLGDRVTDARKSLVGRDRVSDHDAFNMAATCQTLAVLAGKIAQTENVLRWMSKDDGSYTTVGKPTL